MSNVLLSSAAWLLLSHPGIWPTAGPSGADAPGSLTALSQEVGALQVIYALRLSRPQLELLRKMAGETSARPVDDVQAKASAAYRRALGELRDALVHADDDERIGKLSDRYDELRRTEEPDIADDVDYTEEAVQQAPAVLDMLTPAQVAGYLGNVADDIGDPRKILLEALAEVRGLPPDKWAEVRDDVANQVSRLVAGLDDDKARRLSDRVIQLLIVARGLKPDEFKSQQPVLEQKALALIADAGPTDVLRHVMEDALAELLSNPQLPAAIDARLKK